MFEKFSFAIRNGFRGLHNMLNVYHDIYIAKTNRERLNTTTTEMETVGKKKKGSGDSRGIVAWADRPRLRKSKERKQVGRKE